MEHQKMLHLLNEADNSKFARRKWDIVIDQSHANYDVGNEIIYNTKVLKSNLCDLNEAYILVRGVITMARNIAAQGGFENCAPFTKYITGIYRTTIDDSEDLDLVMQIFCILYLKFIYRR